MPEEIVYYPDPVLNKVCRPLTDEEISSGLVDGVPISKIVDDMKHLMKTNFGIGLAAPQVGLPLRLFIVDLGPSAPTQVVAFINPEIVEKSGSEEGMEGCLSLPNVQINVKRATQLKIKAKDVKGIDFEISASAMQARCIQHEHDHLDGRLIITRGNINSNKKNREILDTLERQYKRWNERKQQTAKAT